MHPSTRRPAAGGVLPRSPAPHSLNLSLPLPKPHPHRRSSLLSLNSASSAPHTPRSCSSPSLPLPVYCPSTTAAAGKRNSTDSWNSSNADGEDMDVEWKNEHVLLLSRTLDALPAHLITPFNGPIPPSNLLDKIARGVSQAKGPADWPYSTRATRVKLLELARTRAREEAGAQRVRRGVVIMEEDVAHDVNVDVDVEIDDEGSHYSYFHGGEEKPLSGVGIGPRRPLYRQSSMDFIKPGPGDLKDNPAIARLSTRLQRTDRIIANPSYHPYSRSRIPRVQAQAQVPAQGDATANTTSTTTTTNVKTPTKTPTKTTTKAKNQSKAQNARSSSPPHKNDVPALITQSSSTPSSTTLDSFSSSSLLLSAAPRIVGLRLGMGMGVRMRRSASTMSVSSGSLFSATSSDSNGDGMQLAEDPRIQRVRRSDSDSFSVCSAGTPPVPPPKDGGYGYGSGSGYEGNGRQQRVGVKRAPSYGALAQEVKAKVKSEVKSEVDREKAKEKEKERMHTRQLSGSYPSSDEEEKARGVRAKKSRLMMGGGGGGEGVPPPSPSVVSSVPSSPAGPASASRSGGGGATGPSTPTRMKSMSPRITPQTVPVSVAVSTPAPAPVMKSRIATTTTSKTASKTSATATSGKEDEAGVGSGKGLKGSDKVDASKTGKTQYRMRDKDDNDYGSVDKNANADKSANVVMHGNKDKSQDGRAELGPGFGSKMAAGMGMGMGMGTGTKTGTKTRPPIQRMNLQRNPSMFGAELPGVHDVAVVTSQPATATALASPATTGTKRQSSAPPPSSYTSNGMPSSLSSLGKSRMRSPSPLLSPTLQPSLLPSLSRVHVHAHGTSSRSKANTTSGLNMDEFHTNANANRAMHVSAHAAPLSPSLNDALMGDADADVSMDSPSLSPLGLAPAMSPTPAYSSPASSPKVRTLRRVRRLLAPARRISFGSLVAPGEEADGEGEGEGEEREWNSKRAGAGTGAATGSGAGKMSLGSAFQLH